MQASNNYGILGKRDAFNAFVRHIKTTIALADSLSPKTNIADLILEISAQESFSNEQISAFINMLLVDRLGYYVISKNLDVSNENPVDIAAEIIKWNAVDLVFAYHHPDLGLIVVNPKNDEQLMAVNLLKKRELLLVYVGYADKPADDLCKMAANTFLNITEGKKVKVNESLYKGLHEYKKPVPEKKTEEKKTTRAPAKGRKPAAKTAKSKTGTATKQAAEPVQKTSPSLAATSSRIRMTPLQSVVVSNELFHNGNVEAWKRIVASYKVKYPDLEVYIYYDGERIIDINSLFKWGKVKHGSSIQFAVAGLEIQDVAKLKRYLSQGASPMFEVFLQGPVNNTLKLF